MIALKLVQKTSDGRCKSWKLSQQKTQLTFGTSRKADIVSIDKSTAAFELVFEFQNSKWHCINFNVDQGAADVVLTGNGHINLNDSVLSFEVVEKKAFVVSQLNNIRNSGTDLQNLVLVTHQGRLIRSELAGADKSLEIYSQGSLKKMNLTFNEDWSETNVDDFVVRSKAVKLETARGLAQINAGEILEADSRKSVIWVLGMTFAIVAVSLLVPRNKTETLNVAQKISAPTYIVKTDLKKRKTQPTSVASAPATPAPEGNSGGGSKSAALIKSAIGMRISQLLGKVSATEARSKNIILTSKGLKAGDENAGRALAAVGKVESSGRNWDGESAAKGAGVGTAGIGGGKGTSGFSGGLGKGKTGAGGVGLIEEESEITGGLDREIIAQYIKTQLGQILYCYERQLSASPELFGKIAVRFTIAGTGQVETQAINDTTLKNSSVENCILNKISKWKFPEPKGGTKVLVTYPFLFKSTN